MVKVKTEKRNLNKISEDEMPELNKQVQEHKKDLNQRKQEKAEEFFATKEMLFNHSQRTFTVAIPIDRNEDGSDRKMKFEVRRLTQEERVQLDAIRPINPFAVEKADPEDIRKAEDQGYEILAKVVLKPPMNADEWRELSVDITDTLVSKIALLQRETNDADLIQKLKN